MKAAFSLCLLLTLFCASACGETEDPNGRVEEASEGYCQLRMRCEGSQIAQLPADFFEDCIDGMKMILAVMHHVFGATCIDASLDQVECRLDYDCDFPDGPPCADGGAGCDSALPCEELVPAAERACGHFFIPGPDLGIDSEVQ